MNLFAPKSVKMWMVGLGMAVLVACSVLSPSKPNLPGMITIYAQSLPHQATYFWIPDAATDRVISYTVTCSTAAAPIVVLASSALCSTTQCSTPVMLTALGQQTCNVLATNTSLSGGSDVTGTPQNSLPSTTTFTLNQQPSAPTGNGVK